MEIIDYVYSFAAMSVFAYAIYWVVMRIKNKGASKNFGSGKRPGDPKQPRK